MITHTPTVRQSGGPPLRDLYQALVPNKLRKALGEFLTPYWLAEACLARLRELGADLEHGRVLDPTCGTGTFIVPLLGERLNRLRRAPEGSVTAADVQAVLNGVTGIDLNPVAITATRANFVIALGELAKIGPITLPVWRADSLLVPDAPPTNEGFGPIAGISHVRLETSLPDAFVIPASMTSARRVGQLRALIEEAMPRGQEISQQQADHAAVEFSDSFQAAVGPEGRDPLDVSAEALVDEARVAQHLFSQVLALAQDNRDGVWARLIENAFAPIFAGRFDVVVGNPPWLTWTKLPVGWRTQSEALWKRFGLWYTPEETGDSFSLQSSDIAALRSSAGCDRGE